MDDAQHIWVLIRFLGYDSLKNLKIGADYQKKINISSVRQALDRKHAAELLEWGICLILNICTVTYRHERKSHFTGLLLLPVEHVVAGSMLAQMDSKLTVSFSGHETFPFRYAWLKKGYDGVVDNPTLFSQEDQAMVILGVGKNMVRAIRHWCLATSVLEPISNEKKGGHGLQPSPFGTLLFHDENGVDPYLEDTASLWALHWHIASSPDRCTTWNWAFSHIHDPEFSKEQVLDSLTRWIATHDIKRVSENTLERDIDCFIRTYCPSRNRNQAVIEESLDCPLTELGLLHETTGRSFYRFHRGKKDDMAPGVLLYAVANYWESDSPHANSLSLADIAYSPGSPGRVFQMDEHSMANVLEDAETLSHGNLRYDDTSGLRQLLRKGTVHPQKLLKQAYSRHGATRRKVTVHATR